MNGNMEDIAIKAIAWDKSINDMYEAMAAKWKSKGLPEYAVATVAFTYAKYNMKQKKDELRACIKFYGAS